MPTFYPAERPVDNPEQAAILVTEQPNTATITVRPLVTGATHFAVQWWDDTLSINLASATASLAVPTSGAFTGRTRKTIKVWACNSTGVRQGYISGWATLPASLISYTPAYDTSNATSLALGSSVRNTWLDLSPYSTGSFSFDNENLKWLKINKATSLLFTSSVTNFYHNLDHTLTNLDVSGMALHPSALPSLTGLINLAWGEFSAPDSVVDLSNANNLAVVGMFFSSFTELNLGSKTVSGLIQYEFDDNTELSKVTIGQLNISNPINEPNITLVGCTSYTTDSLHATLTGMSHNNAGGFTINLNGSGARPVVSGPLVDGINHTAASVQALATSKNIILG